MKRTALLLLASGSAFGIIQPSLADTTPQQPLNQHIGFYAEADVGANVYTGVLVTNTDTWSSSGVNGWGWNGAFGYAFGPHFGLEAGFMQNYGHYDINDEDNAEGHTNIPYAAMRFALPLGDRVALFFKLGGMYASVEGSNSSSGTSGESDSLALPFTGIGASYALTSKIDLTAQYQGALYGVINGGLLGLGLTYHF